MAKPKSVKFQHRGNGVDARRQSSGSTDASSEAGSPRKDIRNGIVDEKTPGPSEYEKKKQSFITRTIWTLIMIGGKYPFLARSLDMHMLRVLRRFRARDISFFGLLAAGHVAVLGIITVVVTLAFKEVIAIAQVPARQKDITSTRTLNWYLFAVTMYYLYGESVLYYFKHILLVDKVLLPFATHHRFISFMMYLFGFVFFVMSLKKGSYKFQFRQFAWTHMALFLIVFQAHFMMNNVFEGLIWFFLPVSLVITNDIFAYLCGITFGRTPLIALSPKKTVEGFVGAWVCTVIIGFGLTNLLIKYPYFYCPVSDLGANAFSGLTCDPNPVFIARPCQLPDWTQIDHTFWIAPIQAHIFVLATFASLIAPFGGFFASGLKRSFNIKDFGDSIPGHGGMVDRMDCQFIMATLSYMYYQSFIAVYKTTPGSIIESAMWGLTPEEQMEVIRGLSKHLFNQGVLSEKVLSCVVGQLAKR